MTPHPELLRLLAQMVRDVAKVGPEPLRRAAEQLVYLGWWVRGVRREEAANDSRPPPDLG